MIQPDFQKSNLSSLKRDVKVFSLILLVVAIMERMINN